MLSASRRKTLNHPTEIRRNHGNEDKTVPGIFKTKQKINRNDPGLVAIKTRDNEQSHGRK